MGRQEVGGRPVRGIANPGPTEHGRTMVRGGLPLFDHGIMPDDAGRIYVFPDVAEEAPGSVVDVFRDNGHYLGRLRLPQPIQLSPSTVPVAHFSVDHLYVLVKDELEVAYVARLRIVRGQSP